MKEELEILEQIKMVDAPPFLFTRISQRIANRQENTISPKVSYAIGAAFALLLVVNMLFIFKYRSQEPIASDLVTSMNLLEENSLYK